MMRPQHLSPKGVRFIAGFEGFEAYPYNDPAGNATIGYGHLLHRGKVTQADRAKYPRGITTQQALLLLELDAKIAASCVLEKVHPPFMWQWRFDAICSFVYNLGCSYLDPGHEIADKLNSGYLRRGAADALLLYDRANGVVLPGLKRRREAERRLFLYGRYS